MRALVALLVLACPSCTLLGITNRKVDFEHPEVTTDTGVVVQDQLEGQGPAARAGDSVSVHVTLSVLGADEPFFVSADGGLPVDFEVGAFADLLGLNEGVVGMKPGGVRHLRVPPYRAYGDDGVPGVVEPGATVFAVVEMLEVVPADG
jgi:peptidylprolyl isomerase